MTTVPKGIRTSQSQSNSSKLESKALNWFHPTAAVKPDAINLMDMLEASVERVKDAEPPELPAKKSSRKKSAPKIASAAGSTTKKRATRKKTG